ncbi:MAG: GPR endopeptidase [Acutalibacteraceae bacterium]
MNLRTDLALERHENTNKDEITGVKIEKRNEGEVKISLITVLDEKGEKVLGKPKGRYLTAEFPSLKNSGDDLETLSEILSGEIKAFLPAKGTVLIVGLGNDKITPDALGPECISLLLATRHLKKELVSSLGFPPFRSVAGLVPGVLGNTGIETAEIIKGVTKEISPSAVIIIDALASRSLSRLGNTVQMCDTGVSPGSGVGNRRKPIDSRLLGVPVIAIGVPTVVDAVTVAFDLLEQSGIEITGQKRKEIFETEKTMMVTPKEIDLVIKRAARLISLSINRALQPELSSEDITAIVSVV